MPRPAYKYLWVIAILVTMVSSSWAFYDADNRPEGAPPAYTSIDSAYFMGAPRFADYKSLQLGGYYVYKDTVSGRWNIVSLMWPGGTLFEQLHGSVLVQMDQEPQEGVNVWPIGYVSSTDLRKNDRWGWVKWPEAIAPNLYEIWWDITIDYARLENSADPYDTVGISFTGCAFDFNIWATGHFGPFSPAQVKLGAAMTPISTIAGFADGIPGLSDQYQGASAPKDPNTSVYTFKNLPGASFNANGLLADGDTYGGSRAYEANGLQFSVLACPPSSDNPPVFYPPLGCGKNLTLCLGSTVYDTIRAVDPDAGDILTMTMLSGPGTFVSTPGLSPLYGYYHWTPTAPGFHQIVYQIADSQGHSYVDSVWFRITLNRPPVLDDISDTTIAVCWPGESLCQTLTASDPEDDSLTFRLLDGIGSIDPVTGELCFDPMEGGEYGFLVAVADSCGADTVSFIITIEGNQPPRINPLDSVVVLCAIDTICFEVTASDPDAADSLAIMQLGGPGRFIQTANGRGRQCFLPAELDSARYVFHYGVTDDCLRKETADKTVPPMPSDSIIIIVLIDRPPTIVCPPNDQRFLCAPETICFELGGDDPDGDFLTYQLLSGPGTVDPISGKLCFLADHNGTYAFAARVNDTCGLSDTCEFKVQIDMNRPPVVQAPADTTIATCQMQEICLNGFDATDPDGNLVTTEILPALGQLSGSRYCLTPDTSGTYPLVIRATDACGATASDTVTVTVALHKDVSIACPEGVQTLTLCQPGPVCLPIAVTPATANVRVAIGDGYYKDGSLCFTAGSSGRYAFTLVADGDCGDDTCTVVFDIAVNSPPTVRLPDTTVWLCQPAEICLPLTFSDPDNDIVSINVQSRKYLVTEGEVCYMAEGAGQDRIIVTVTDSCGHRAVDTAVITVVINEAPKVEVSDTTLFICGPTEICLPVTATDPDGVIDSIVVSKPGRYNAADQTICLETAASGRYELLVVVYDNCGVTATAMPVVTVTANQPPVVTAPPDTTVLQCAAEEICLGGFIITDANDNISSVTVTPPVGQWRDGQYCFTPEEAGRYCLVVTATDSCGILAQDTVCVTVTRGASPTLVCPPAPIDKALCRADSICVPITVNPAGAGITVPDDRAVYRDGELCFYASESGEYRFAVIAADECGSDTCEVVVNVTIGAPPVVICPQNMNKHLCGPDMVTVPVTIQPTNASVQVWPVGEYSNGLVTFRADTAGTYCLNIAGTTDCGADTCSVCITVTMDAPPQVTVPDSTVTLCELAEICLPVTLSDPDGNIASVTVLPEGATFADGIVCFMPEGAGHNEIIITVTDSCGHQTIDTAKVDVILNQPPLVSIPDSTLESCRPGDVCLPVTASDPDGVITSIEATPPAVYNAANHTVCLPVSGTGEYRVTVTVTDNCGATTAITAVITVPVNVPPIVHIPDTSLSICGPTEICLPVTASDPAGILTSIEAEAPAAYDPIAKTVCLTVSASGDYQVAVTVMDDCGAAVRTVATIRITLNASPQVAVPADTSIFQCEPAQVCLEGFAASDIDGNLLVVTVTPDIGRLADGVYCFTPDTVGTYRLAFQATDSCGATAADTLTIQVQRGTPPVVSCPDPQVAALCHADSVCIPVTVTPAGAIVTILEPGAVYRDGKVCFYAAENGTYRFTVVATGGCGSDTCVAEADVTVGIPPVISCPETVSKHLCGPDAVTIPVTISPADAIIRVEPAGVYQNGQVRFPVTTAGMHCVSVIAETDCGADTCTVCVDVTFDRPPQVHLADSSVTLCQPSEVCLPLTFSDPDDNIVSVTIQSPRYTVTEGEVCFYADAAGLNEIIVVVTDSCGNTAADTARVMVTMNSGPTVAIPDTAVFVCGPTMVCLPVTASDPDGVIDSVVVSPPAAYNAADKTVCLTVSKTGHYDVMVIVYDDCGASASDIATISVTLNTPPQATAPADTALSLCGPQEICLNGFSALDIDGNLANVIILPALGIYSNGRFCFTPEAAGAYRFVIRATDSCGASAEDTVAVTITMNQKPLVTVNDTSLFVCEATDVCLPVVLSDPDGHIDSVRVTPAGYYDAAKQTICLPVAVAGTYTITVTVYDDCGASASDQARVTATFNHPPDLAITGIPAELTLCQLAQVCVPIEVSDIDNNLTTVLATTDCASGVVFNPQTSMLCWTPRAYGICHLTIIAVDACGKADTATAAVNIREGVQPDARCPRDTTVRICAPGEVRLSVGSLGHAVTIRPSYFSYNAATGILSYNVLGNRVDTVWVRDVTECGVDSCFFVLRTVLNQAPTITGDMPMAGRFCDPFTYCLNVEVSDPDNNIASVAVADGCYGAYYDTASNKVCIPVAGDIDCTVNVVVTDSCGLSAGWSARVVMKRNHPPTISLPDMTTTTRCDSDTAALVIPGICVSDADYDAVTLTLDSGDGSLTFDAATNCGTLLFLPPTNDSAKYCFRFRAVDICDTVYKSYCFTILPTPVCSSCVTVSLVGPGCVSPGANATVSVKVDAQNTIAAYDLLIAYDATALNFLQAGIGPAITSWEYFTYRYGAQGNCSGSCPSGILRLVALADMNNGAHHPRPEELSPQGIIASINFRVMNNQLLGGMAIPVSFFWFDCGDNTFSDPTGKYLLLDQAVYSAEGNILWDEYNEGVFPESHRLPNVGAPDSCLTGGEKGQPLRCVTFRNGAVCIMHPDSVDARGDVNLNGVSYEIADAVVYTNYFLYGLRAFSFSVPGQIAASDINADGVTLSVADLVYLIRIITGDAQPYEKARVGGTVTVACETDHDQVRVTVDGSNDIGAALLIFECSEGQSGDPVLSPAAAGMEIKFTRTEENELRVLLYSFEGGRMMTSGELLTIPVSGGSLVLKEVEMADYQGGQLTTAFDNKVVPRLLELTQNRPNPFNPTTTFSLGLPEPSDYVVRIFNVTGQIVRTWSGSAPAGYITFEWDGTDDNGAKVASGIYLYRAHAAGAEAIRKMVLIK